MPPWLFPAIVFSSNPHVNEMWRAWFEITKARQFQGCPYLWLEASEAERFWSYVLLQPVSLAGRPLGGAWVFQVLNHGAGLFGCTFLCSLGRGRSQWDSTLVIRISTFCMVTVFMVLEMVAVFQQSQCLHGLKNGSPNGMFQVFNISTNSTLFIYELDYEIVLGIVTLQSKIHQPLEVL